MPAIKNNTSFFNYLIFLLFCHKRNVSFSHFSAFQILIMTTGERYDFVINADQPVGAYWIQLRGLGECGIRRVQQLAILRYARGPYQPTSPAPTYDVGIPQGVVSNIIFNRAKRKIMKKNKKFISGFLE